jgi:hypothetical protein
MSSTCLRCVSSSQACLLSAIRKGTLRHNSLGADRRLPPVPGTRWAALQQTMQIHVTVQYSTVRYGTIQYGTIQYGTVRYGAVRYSTVQYGTVRCGTVPEHRGWWEGTQLATREPWLMCMHCLCTPVAHIRRSSSSTSSSKRAQSEPQLYTTGAGKLMDVCCRPSATPSRSQHCADPYTDHGYHWSNVKC